MVISVSLGAQSYPILLEAGALARAGQHLSLARRVLVVTDSGVPQEYARTVAGACRQARICTLPAGENSKNMDNYQRLLREMLALSMDRGDCVAAVGGGMAGDLAGFAAATYMRGVDFYNVPTTLLAQADSSIGGKVAIDHPRGKNLIGTFYQPVLVVTDTALLSTLPREHLASGMAEVIKCGAISSGDLNSGEDDLTRTVYRTAMIKAGYVQADTKDTGIRRELNFGHTIGHALERASGFELLHGCGVSIGRVAMAKIGESMGLTEPGTAEQLISALSAAGLPTEMENIDKDAFRAAMLLDKKGDGETVNAVFLKKIGHCLLYTSPSPRDTR